MNKHAYTSFSNLISSLNFQIPTAQKQKNFYKKKINICTFEYAKTITGKVNIYNILL